MADLRTLGVNHHMLTYTSDHFDTLAKWADWMIEHNYAYVDDTGVEEMRKMRMDGIESKSRNQPKEETIRLWKLMQIGDPEGVKCCMRAKIDMKANNKTLRDPVIYRCNVNTPHHRTG
jgi:glutamyl-tRNA synthetase